MDLIEILNRQDATPDEVNEQIINLKESQVSLRKDMKFWKTELSSDNHKDLTGVIDDPSSHIFKKFYDTASRRVEAREEIIKELNEIKVDIIGDEIMMELKEIDKALKALELKQEEIFDEIRTLNYRKENIEDEFEDMLPVSCR